MATTEAHTPEQNANIRSSGITEMQRQALVSNLQLEITERARKLRTQYVLQAQSLRARLEMRINRIPQALRKRTMQDLLADHTSPKKPAPAAVIPVAFRAPHMIAVDAAKPRVKPAQKRKSDELSAADDKENDPLSADAHDLANPKKRSKTAAGTTTAVGNKTARTASRRGGPTAVLSPKSHNSRTLPASPLKSINQAPAKSALQSRAATTTATATRPTASSRSTSRQIQRKTGAAESEGLGRESDASNNSTSTTIVNKPRSTATAAARKPTKTTAPRKTTTTSKSTTSTTATTKARQGSERAIAAKSGEVTNAAAGGGRTLRKRN